MNQAWAKMHSLKLIQAFAGREVRSTYISSIIGECFHIWIDPPSGGFVTIFAECVEGKLEDAPPQHWVTSVDDLNICLERVYEVVIQWMAPSNPASF